MTLRFCLSCLSTSAVVYPATESFVAVTDLPLLAARSSAVSGGYGLQSQFVPRGTESPRATIDHVLGALDVVAAEQAVATRASPTSAARSATERRRGI